LGVREQRLQGGGAKFERVEFSGKIWLFEKYAQGFYDVKFGVWNFAILNSAPGILQRNFAAKFCLVEL